MTGAGAVRGLLGWALAWGLALSCGPALAQPHPVYVAAGTTDQHAYRYLDLASVHRDEGASEYEFLQVEPPGGAIDLRLVTVRLSCALGRYSFVSGRIRHRGGEWTSLSVGEAGIWNEVLEPDLVALVCQGAGRPADMPVWNSMDEAISAARREQARVTPPPPPPQPPPPPPSAAPPLPREPPNAAPESVEPGPDTTDADKAPDETAEPEKPPEADEEPEKGPPEPLGDPLLDKN